MYSNAKAIALMRDLTNKLQIRFGQSGTPASMNSFTQGFSAPDAAGGTWPYVLFYNAAAGAGTGNPVIFIEIAGIDAVSKDIFGNDTDSYAPHKLLLGYEQGAAQTYSYTVTSANATAGAVYTNNGNSFIVNSTIAGGTTLTSTGTLAPTASGTLTKASGTGDATITFSAFGTPGNPSTWVSPADLLAVEFEAIKTGVALTLVEVANGAGVTAATVSAATPVATIDDLYWPTKLV